MPCISRPAVPTPTLPSPFSIPKPPPIPNIEPQFCCTLPPIPNPPPIPNIPGVVVTSAIIVLLDEGVDTVIAFLDKIPTKCPKEL